MYPHPPEQPQRKSKPRPGRLITAVAAITLALAIPHAVWAQHHGGGHRGGGHVGGIHNGSSGGFHGGRSGGLHGGFHGSRFGGFHGSRFGGLHSRHSGRFHGGRHGLSYRHSNYRPYRYSYHANSYPHYYDLTRRSNARVYYGGGTYALTRRYYGDANQNATVYEPAAVPNDYPTPTPTTQIDSPSVSGWDLLTQRQYQQALAQFAREAQRNPTQGEPKIGYAISAALAGDRAVGVWAMRRALTADIGALHNVPNLAQDGTFDRVIDLYEGAYEPDSPQADTAFMLAVLYDLQGRVNAARIMIDQAIDAGDDSPSAAAFRQMLQDDYPRELTPAQADEGPEPAAPYAP